MDSLRTGAAILKEYLDLEIEKQERADRAKKSEKEAREAAAAKASPSARSRGFMLLTSMTIRSSSLTWMTGGRKS